MAEAPGSAGCAPTRSLRAPVGSALVRTPAHRRRGARQRAGLPAAALGAGLRNAMLAILLVSWPEFSRLMRGQVLAIKENDYVIAARALGAPAPRVVLTHILTNSFPPIEMSCAVSAVIAGAANILPSRAEPVSAMPRIG